MEPSYLGLQEPIFRLPEAIRDNSGDSTTISTVLRVYRTERIPGSIFNSFQTCTPTISDTQDRDVEIAHGASPSLNSIEYITHRRLITLATLQSAGAKIASSCYGF